MRWDDRSQESRWREEDLDEYEEEDGDGYEEEEDEVEEEEPKLTQEEMNYLKMRERMKEKIRQKYRKENAADHGRSAASADRKRVSTNSEFGSFFGPSQPVIARRVIEESHSIRETQHITSKMPKSNPDNKRAPSSANGERKIRAPKAVSELKSKVETLKDTRDYSFLLSDDNDIPAPQKDPPSRSSHVSNSNALSFQAQQKASTPANKPLRPVNGVHNVKKPTSSTQQVQVRGLLKASPESRSKPSSGSGPGRPPAQKTMNSAAQNIGLKRSSAMMANKQNPERKSIGMKPDSSSKQQHYEQRRQIQGQPKAMVPPRQSTSIANVNHQKPKPVLNSSKPAGYSSKPQQAAYTSKPQQAAYSSKPQQAAHSSNPQRSGCPSKPLQTGHSSKPMQTGYSSKTQERGYPSKSEQRGRSLEPQRSKPSKQLSHRGSAENNLKRKPTNRYPDEDDDGDEISMIRKMFGYNPNRYQDEDDDSDMEANFDDIMKEERRSSKIAQMEDEEQLRLNEEEERQEKMRKLAKKRRLG